MDSEQQTWGATADDNETENSQNSRVKLLYKAILLAGLSAASNLTTSEVVLCLDPMRRYRAMPAPATISLAATTVSRANQALGIQLEPAVAAVEAVARGKVIGCHRRSGLSLREGGFGGGQPGTPSEHAAGSITPLPQSGLDNPNSSSPAPGSSVTGSQKFLPGY